MRSNFRTYLNIVLLIGILCSCSKHAPKEAKYIPKDISAVLAVDPKSMQDKLEKAGVSMDTLIDRLFKKDTFDTLDKARFYELKGNAGIDWNSKLYFFGLQKGEGKGVQATVLNIMGKLSDAAKFETYLKKQDQLSAKSVQKEKNYSYLVISSESMIAWDGNTVIGTFYNKNVTPVYDTVAMKFIIPEKTNTEAEMKAEVNRYFTQQESESLASVASFGDIFRNKSDGYAFSSTNSYLNILSVMPLQLPKLDELVKDNYMSATLNFEDGKIVANATSYTNPLVSSLLKKYAGPTVNLSLIDHYPSENINMIVMASFNPEIFGGLLKQLEVEGLVNGFMEKTGFSSQELYKSLKGDIAVVVSDLGMPSKEMKIKNDSTLTIEHKPFGKMIFNAPVGDPVSFAKIMNKAVELGYVTKEGNRFKAGNLMSFMGMYMLADDKNLIIASDSITYAQYVSNKNKAVIGNDALNLFKGKSTVAYFDIASTIKGFQSGSNSDYKNSMSSAKQIFKDMIATTDNFDGEAVRGKFEIRMSNEKQNSLVTLAGLFTDIATDMRMASKKEQEQEKRMFPSGVPAIIRTN